MLSMRALLGVFFVVALCSVTCANESRFVLWQLPAQTSSQMMSYVIQTSGGKTVVIDGGTTGDAAYLRKFLKDHGGRVDMWFISHPHSDHVNALTAILGDPQGLEIGRILASLSDEAWTDRVEPQEAAALKSFDAVLSKSKRPVVNLVRGAVFMIDGVRIEVLGVRNPEIETGLNDSSVVLRVSDSSRSVLFLGDLGSNGGVKLLKYAGEDRLKSDYVQMAHHGQNGVNEDVYKAVNARVCLWPTPKWLWDNDSGAGKGSGPWKTLVVRGWMEKLNIKRNYVIGLDGLACVK